MDMEGEQKSKKLDLNREKQISSNVRKKMLQEKKSKSESLTSLREEGGGGGGKSSMIVVGKGCKFTKSRSYDLSRSDSSLNPMVVKRKSKETVSGEGLQIGLPVSCPSGSTASFASAKSQVGNTEALQRKIVEMEDELSGKNATIARLKKELGKTEVVYRSACVETDSTCETMEGYQEKMEKKKEELEETRLKYEKEMEELAEDYEAELEKLRGILAEMQENGSNSLLIHEIESKHERAMEELRTYFEQKCSDLEKQYSEEVFSEQSRKMSSGSWNSENEFPSRISNEEEENEKYKKCHFLYDLMEEINGTNSKHTKQVINLEAKHISEMNAANLQLDKIRDDSELEKEIFDDEEKLKEKRKKKSQEEEILFEEDVPVPVRNAVDDEEKFKMADYYRKLNEEALRRFSDEQGKSIKCHFRVVQNLIREYEKRIRDLKESQEECAVGNCQQRIKELEKREKELSILLDSIKSTYEEELMQVRRECQTTLEEQVLLAKTDALNCLQQQIEEYLEEKEESSPVPEDVLALQEKFAGKWRKEIEELKEKHEGEVKRMKMEYEERIGRRHSTGSMPKRCVSDSSGLKTDDDKLEIARERDALQEMVATLRHVLGELVRYVAIYENELDNAVVDEFVEAEETLYKSIAVDADETDRSLASLLLNASVQVRIELDKCLKQLKKDAKCILALSNPTFSELIKKMQTDKNCLNDKVCLLEKEHQILQLEVEKTKEKLLEYERNREVVTEGFGEEIIQAQKTMTLSEHLRDKAKSLLGDVGHSSNVLNMIEEICKEGDRLQEESKREKQDLQQQVAAADKQLKNTRRFLEEQAFEREQERDEYLSEIKKLSEALKAKERDNFLKSRINQEVEALENQLKEVSRRLEETEKSRSELEGDYKTAVDKIWSLREIISDLEAQIAVAGEREFQLENKINQLENVIQQQSRDNQIIASELDSMKSQNTIETCEQIKSLEDELSSLRHLTEEMNLENLTEMKCKLGEIEFALVKKTRDLEQIYVSSANVSCSSPSEDVSIREHLDATRCPTPDEMNCGDRQQKKLPFEEIDRILEKLTKHNRVEEVVIKSWRDLEMQVKNAKKCQEEIQAERDVLLEKVESYLQENSSLKARLDEQRCNAGILQRQLSADLESQIKRLQSDVEKSNSLCLQKDKQLRETSAVLERTTKSLKARENEAVNKSKEENVLIIALKSDLQKALDEKVRLEEKVQIMSSSARNEATLPVLVESMIEEKNAEIDRLEKEVERLKSQRASSSLIANKFGRSFDAESPDDSSESKKVRFSRPDSFVDFISPILPENSSNVVRRSGSDSYADLKISFRRLSKPLHCISTPESVSSIGALQLSPRGLEPEKQSSWNNSHRTWMNFTQMMNRDLENLRKQLELKTEELRKCESELSERRAVEAEIGKIRNQLKTTMQAVEEDKRFYKKHFEQMLETETKLGKEVDSKRREISELVLEMDCLRQKLAEETEKRNEKDAKIVGLIEKLELERKKGETALNEIRILEDVKSKIEQDFSSLRQDFSKELSHVKEENKKLKCDYFELQKDLEKNCPSLGRKADDAGTQTEIERRDEFCQTTDERLPESNRFRLEINRLKVEIQDWENKLEEGNLKNEEILSLIALIRTRLSCLVDDLDHHFYQLENYREKVMECSVDDLTDKVQRELVLSAKLDNKLLTNLKNATNLDSSQPASLESVADGNGNGAGGHDNLALLHQKTDFVTSTVKICELEANLQETTERNKELEMELENLKKEAKELKKRIDEKETSLKSMQENLSEKLKAEKSRCNEDAKIMEALRINFEKGLEKIAELETELSLEKEKKILIEKQVGSISDLKCQLDSEKQKVLSLGFQIEKEKRKCEEFASLLEQEKSERISEKDVQRRMANDLAILQERKQNLESQLSNAKQVVKTSQTEISLLKRKLSVMEIETKRCCVCNEKEWDASVMTDRISGLEREVDFYRSQVLTLTERSGKMITEPLLLKMKNLNSCVEKHVLESSEMGEALLHLTQETEQMKSLIRKLEESAENEDGTKSEKTLLADVTDTEKEKLTAELADLQKRNENLQRCNSQLKLQVRKLTQETETWKENRTIGDDDSGVAQDRIVHLFGKYMRAESYRKALAWQKRYLSVVIAGYEDSEKEARITLNEIIGKNVKRTKTKRKSWKGVALAVVAVKRMQFMVKRWKHGRIAGVEALLSRLPDNRRRPSSTMSLSNEPIDPLQYQTRHFVRCYSQPVKTPLRVTESIQRFSRLQKNLGLSGGPS